MNKFYLMPSALAQTTDQDETEMERMKTIGRKLKRFYVEKNIPSDVKQRLMNSLVEEEQELKHNQRTRHIPKETNVETSQPVEKKERKKPQKVEKTPKKVVKKKSFEPVTAYESADEYFPAEPEFTNVSSPKLPQPIVRKPNPAENPDTMEDNEPPPQQLVFQSVGDAAKYLVGSADIKLSKRVMAFDLLKLLISDVGFQMSRGGYLIMPGGDGDDSFDRERVKQLLHDFFDDTISGTRSVPNLDMLRVLKYAVEKGDKKVTSFMESLPNKAIRKILAGDTHSLSEKWQKQIPEMVNKWSK